MAAPKGPLTAEEHAAIKRLHSEGKSLTEISKVTGRSKAAISRWCKDQGLSFDTSKVAVAVLSHKDRMAAKRAVLESRYLEEAERDLSAKTTPVTEVIFDKLGHRQTVTRPATPHELKALTQSSTTAFAAAIRAHEVDGNAASTEKAKSMLGGLFDAMKERYTEEA